MAAKSETQTAEYAHVPAAEMSHLDALVGKWNTEWWAKENPADPPVKTTGTDTYEWLPGGFFLIHKVEARMDYGIYNVLEIIGGYDPDTQTYPMRSFDSQGNAQTMTARVDDKGVWTFFDTKMRATLNVGSDGRTMTAKWERTTDGTTWTHWMDMKFTKAT